MTSISKLQKKPIQSTTQRIGVSQEDQKHNLVQLSDSEYTLNGKRIFKDFEGTWIGSQEITTREVAFFQRHLLSLNELSINQ